jgi:hypothetical protein
MGLFCGFALKKPFSSSLSLWEKGREEAFFLQKNPDRRV